MTDQHTTPDAASRSPGDPTAPPRPRRRALRVVLTAVGGVMLVVLAFAAFLLLKPMDVPTETARANPTASYDEAIARFAEVERREAGQDLLPLCRSRILDSDERAERSIVLFHGYTNCPQMFEQLGEELAAQGFNVYIPLAPEHGEADREHSTLEHLSAEELIAYANEAVDIAAGLGDEVTVLGLSGGGSVAAYAAQFRDDVDLAVPVAPFFGLLQVPAPLTSALVNLADLLPPVAWGIPESVASGGEYAPYAGLDNNTRSAAAYMRLGRMVLADAADRPHRAARVVTVVNDGDDTVNNDLTDELTSRWLDLATGATSEYRFPASLGLPHDLIGPDRVDQRTSEVYPVLLEIIGAS
jgi:pimeloyl-ACP methyl ester carboxylesterase